MTVQSPSPAAPRMEGLDALRGVAAVLVIMLHASMPYLLRPMPGLLWPARDASPSPLVDALGWAIEGFVMPLFFLLSGLFAAGLLERLGPAEFVKHRARRLLAPLLFGLVVILPLDFCVWMVGLMSDGRCTWRQFCRMKFSPEVSRELWGLCHLWFLQYLFLLCAGMAAWGALRKNKAADGIRGFLRARSEAEPPVGRAGGSQSLDPSHPPGWMAGLLPTLAAVTLVLWWEPNVVVGFQHSFLPVPPKFLHAAAFFTLGAWLAGNEAARQGMVRHGWTLLAVAALAFGGLLPLIHAHQAAPLEGWPRLALAAAAATFAVTISLGLFGTFLGSLPHSPPALKRLAEASFWIYLAHHPLVGLIEVDLVRLAWPAAAKFAVVTLLALALTVASYEALVRDTWVGTLLNGRRTKPPVAPPTPAADRQGPLKAAA